MVTKFHEELEALKRDVLGMGRLASDMLGRSVAALKDQDTEEARWVLSQKARLAELDDRIEEEALRLIALHQPMAKDLRTLACILKMITYLTRIGRYGKDIANVAVELAEAPHVKKLVSIPHMWQIASGMTADALAAFETEDLAPLGDFHERDDTLDALRYSIMRECITYMMEDPKTITRCIHYIMVARYLERCGDNCCKIAEKVHFMVTGERIEIK